MPARVHPTALIEEGVLLGDGTAVWDNVHIRHGTRIGEQCIIGEKTYIAYDVVLGNRVKINAFVYVCTGVTIEDGVMVSAGTIFTNDRFPRATTPDLKALRSSDPDEHTRRTLVREGATLGAVGSVVTRSVPDFFLVVGNPARAVGCVCRCGEPTLRFDGEAPDYADMTCSACGRGYAIRGENCYELPPP